MSIKQKVFKYGTILYLSLILLFLTGLAFFITLQPQNTFHYPPTNKKLYTAAATTPSATLKPQSATPSAISITNPPVTNPSPEPLTDSEDHREFMHGIDFVKLNGKNLLIFSSNNYPPTQPDNEWIDDVYYSWIDLINPNGSFSPQTLVSRSMAQEPASAAVNSNDKLAVTTEDAEYSADLDQTFGMWDKNLTPTVNYGQKLMPPQGGHSGHIAASGDKFLVSFSDGWIDGGGVDNLGTGDNVFAKIINNDGTTGSLIKTAVGESNRDWWPLVAGSDTNWLQIWCRYNTPGTGGGTVQGAIIDHSGKITKTLTIYNNNKYYYYDVQYLPSLNLFLVLGSQNTNSNSGIAVLVDKNGNIVASKTGLPNTVREGQTAINTEGTVAVYPTEPTGAAVLDITKNEITLKKTVPLTWQWDYMGTDGIFVNDKRVLFATESQKGIRFITVDF